MKTKALLMLSSALILFTTQVSANAVDKGKSLYEGNCLSCHDANLDPPLAPPMFGVKHFYSRASYSEQDFIDQFTAFTLDPAQNEALMKDAVVVLGKMPNLGMAKEDVLLISKYIFDTTFPPPCNHWIAGMKRAKAEGDMKHFKKDQKQYNKMCME